MTEVEKEPKKRSVSRTWTAVTALLLTLFGFLAFNVASGAWQFRPVLSGSMRPGFPVGGVVVTEREPISDLRVNSVIVTHPPGEPHFDLIHRVIEIKSQSAGSVTVQTKGDDNPAPDPFVVQVHGPWIYQVRYAVPVVGYPALWAHSPQGRRIMLGFAVLVFLAVTIRVMVQRLLPRKPGFPAPGSVIPVTGSDA